LPLSAEAWSLIDLNPGTTPSTTHSPGTNQPAASRSSQLIYVKAH